MKMKKTSEERKISITINESVVELDRKLDARPEIRKTFIIIQTKKRNS